MARVARYCVERSAKQVSSLYTAVKGFRRTLFLLQFLTRVIFTSTLLSSVARTPGGRVETTPDSIDPRFAYERRRAAEHQALREEQRARRRAIVKRRTQRRKCKPCGLNFESVAQQAAHFAGRRHAARITAIKDGVQVCTPCDRCFHSRKQLQEHLGGKGHRNTVRAEVKRVERAQVQQGLAEIRALEQAEADRRARAEAARKAEQEAKEAALKDIRRRKRAAKKAGNTWLTLSLLKEKEDDE